MTISYVELSHTDVITNFPWINELNANMETENEIAKRTFYKCVFNSKVCYLVCASPLLILSEASNLGRQLMSYPTSNINTSKLRVYPHNVMTAPFFLLTEEQMIIYQTQAREQLTISEAYYYPIESNQNLSVPTYNNQAADVNHNPFMQYNINNSNNIPMAFPFWQMPDNSYHAFNSVPQEIISPPVLTKKKSEYKIRKTPARQTHTALNYDDVNKDLSWLATLQNDPNPKVVAYKSKTFYKCKFMGEIVYIILPDDGTFGLAQWNRLRGNLSDCLAKIPVQRILKYYRHNGDEITYPNFIMLSAEQMNALNERNSNRLTIVDMLPIEEYEIRTEMRAVENEGESALQQTNIPKRIRPVSMHTRLEYDDVNQHLSWLKSLKNPSEYSRYPSKTFYKCKFMDEIVYIILPDVDASDSQMRHLRENMSTRLAKLPVPRTLKYYCDNKDKTTAYPNFIMLSEVQVHALNNFKNNKLKLVEILTMEANEIRTTAPRRAEDEEESGLQQTNDSLDHFFDDFGVNDTAFNELALPNMQSDELSQSMQTGCVSSPPPAFEKRRDNLCDFSVADSALLNLDDALSLELYRNLIDQGQLLFGSVDDNTPSRVSELGLNSTTHNTKNGSPSRFYNLVDSVPQVTPPSANEVIDLTNQTPSISSSPLPMNHNELIIVDKLSKDENEIRTTQSRKVRDEEEDALPQSKRQKTNESPVNFYDDFGLDGGVFELESQSMQTPCVSSLPPVLAAPDLSDIVLESSSLPLFGLEDAESLVAYKKLIHKGELVFDPVDDNTSSTASQQRSSSPQTIIKKNG